jgi:hypothetical protein
MDDGTEPPPPPLPGPTADPFPPEVPKEVYKTLVDYYLHQNLLGWSRTRLLVVVEAGVLASAFAKPDLALVILCFGSVLVGLLWALVERDWIVRDQNLELINKIHRPLGVRMGPQSDQIGKPLPGTRIIRIVFVLLLLANGVLMLLFGLATYGTSATLDLFRSS